MAQRTGSPQALVAFLVLPCHAATVYTLCYTLEVGAIPCTMRHPMHPF